MCWVCVVPSALTAEPLGYVSLQQPLEQIFELCGERVWQLHILRKRGGRREGGREGGKTQEGGKVRMGCLKID